MVGGEWMIIWAFVNTGLFVAAAGSVLVSVVSNRLAERFGRGGWRAVTLWSRRIAEVLTFLLILAVLATTPVIAAFVGYCLMLPG